jgi:hypothetical protein
LAEAAWAHGEEVELVLKSQLIAVVVAGVIAWSVSRLVMVRSAIFLAAIAAAFVTWNLPGAVEDVLLGKDPSEGRLIILGLAPAIIASVIAFLWRSLNREGRT